MLAKAQYKNKILEELRGLKHTLCSNQAITYSIWASNTVFGQQLLSAERHFD